MYLLMIEIIFGVLILFIPYSIQHKNIPLISYFSLMILGSFIFTMLLVKYPEKAKLIYVILLVPCIIMAGKWLEFHILGALLIALFIFWRTLSHFNESDKQNEGKWILFTTLAGIFLLYFAGISSDYYMEIIGAVMISQLLFIIIGGFMRRWLAVDANMKHKRPFFLPLFGLLAGMGLVGIILTAGMKLYEKLFFSILSVGVSVLAFLASPFFNWAEGQNWSKIMEQFNKSEDSSEDTVIPSVIEGFGEKPSIDMALIGTVIFIIVLTVLFFYIYKRGKMKLIEKKGHSPDGYSSESFFIKGNDSFFGKIKSNPPNHPIRKEIYDFEKFAKKRNLGRLSHESLSDWMNRIGILDMKEIITIYEKIRYGASTYSEEEEKLIREKLQLKKLEIKNRRVDKLS